MKNPASLKRGAGFCIEWYTSPQWNYCLTEVVDAESTLVASALTMGPDLQIHPSFIKLLPTRFCIIAGPADKICSPEDHCEGPPFQSFEVGTILSDH